MRRVLIRKLSHRPLNDFFQNCNALDRHQITVISFLVLSTFLDHQKVKREREVDKTNKGTEITLKGVHLQMVVGSTDCGTALNNTVGGAVANDFGSSWNELISSIRVIE